MIKDTLLFAVHRDRLEEGKMLNCPKRLPYRKISLLLIPIVLLLFSSPAFSKKVKVPATATGPVKVLLLPFEVSEAHKDLRWTALAAPVLLAKEIEKTQDLVLIPLWQTMPTAIATAGASRTFNDESAASTAIWLGAKWSILGRIAPVKKRISLTIDFIPDRRNQSAFRSLKDRRLQLLGPVFHEAIRQFLRYLTARPIERAKGNEPGLDSVKDIAEALDREYGWSVDADPGKAEKVVARLAQTDEALARLLFNPSLYPVLAQSK
jgi:hypothetical protein